jgi:hypothetical protein
LKIGNRSISNRQSEICNPPEVSAVRGVKFW